MTAPETHRLVLALSRIFRSYGGIPRFNQVLCLALDDLAGSDGLDVTVLSQDDDLEDYRRHGAPWRHLEFTPGGGPLRLVARSLATCARSQPDLLLLGLAGMTPLGLACAPFLRRGYGFIGHGAECWREPRVSRRAATRRARVTWAVSDHTARGMREVLGVPAERLRRLPNSLPPAFEARAGSSAPEPATSPPEVLCVARLWREAAEKGVDHLLRAFAGIGRRHRNARLRIVGEGSDRERLVALAGELGLGERVLFEADVDDDALAERYRRCALFALPSGREGFGVVFLEAMRFARPCLAANARGIPEVVSHDQTGLLVPYGDVEALVAALERLLDSPDLRLQLGRAGRERYDTEFCFSRFRERVGELLAEWLPPAQTASEKTESCAAKHSPAQSGAV